MYPIIENDWLGHKNEIPDEQQHLGSVARSWQWREMGSNPPNSPPNKTVLENIAEDILVQKKLNIRSCDLPGYPRSTFLMVFSPDGTKVASTHGNHNVYVSELASGKHVRILKGHPRTPWCIAFHPSHPQLIGSGCLGGQVRVWDLSGGSEVWNVESETVIASIAFHPRDQLLVIATFNELYFWDWSQPAPFTKVSTNSVNEKVRYVAFDSLGYKLITGISVWNVPGGTSTLLQNTAQQSVNRTPTNQNTTRLETTNENPAQRPQENSDSAQDMMVNSYQNLVQRYDSLVRNYQRLFMARHQLNNTSATNTTDRGTDPMETDGSTSSPGPSTSAWSPNPRSSAVTNENETSHEPELSDSGDEGSGGRRLLNFDILSLNPTGDGESGGSTNLTRSFFGSRTSAFQRINDNAERSENGESSRNERPNLLPNPFSTTNRQSYSYNIDTNAGSSRTSVFSPYRARARRIILSRRRNLSTSANQTSTTSTNTSPPAATDTLGSSLDTLLNHDIDATQENTYSTNNTTTQMSPDAAQTINESLDLIRDILRDSGTRLLNLITNMSLSTLANVERNIPRRSRSDDGDSPRRRSRLSVITSNLRRDFLSSESDTDADRYMEVNIFRTRNSSFQEESTRRNYSNDVIHLPTNRMEVELNGERGTLNLNGEDDEERVSMSSLINRFHVRSRSTGERENNEREDSSPTSRLERPYPDPGVMFDPNRPSTSRDTSWIEDPLSLSDRPRSTTSAEACRKVRTGVNALNKHTAILTDMWIRGSRVSMQDLRNMWENLRRRVLSLQRQSGTQDVPSYYTSSLRERCNLLSEMTRNLGRISPRPRSYQTVEDSTGNNDDSQNTHIYTDSTGSSLQADETRISSGWLRGLGGRMGRVERRETGGGGGRRETGGGGGRRETGGRAVRGAIHWRRRITSARCRVDDTRRRNDDTRRRNDDTRRRNEDTRRRADDTRRRADDTRRRDRRPPRISTRPPRSSRFMQLHCTRNQIRMRAMQVLSIMFNMMMNCLEERGLSQLIIVMLRTLKKALALTCLMLMTNRLRRRDDEQPNAGNTGSEPTAQQRHDNVASGSTATAPSSSRLDTNAHDSTSSWPTSDSDTESNVRKVKITKTSKAKGVTSRKPEVPADNRTPPQRWSNRLAVQIAAANRNTSTTARSRRDYYIEMQRMKALHRTNPTAHPLIRKRVIPPVLSHRIPALRCYPHKPRHLSDTASSESRCSRETQPATSGVDPPQEGNNQNDIMSDFDHRVNLFRIAHMHAVRMRNAARNRYRRLPTIRVYAPSSVREMFSLHGNNNESSSDVPNTVRGPLARRGLGPYRPHILTTRNEVFTREPRFHSWYNNVAVPIMQVNDPTTNEPQRGQPPRLPRVHDYLQPIILAQNALVVEDGGGGGGLGGLLETGLLPDPSPVTHRVQAWDFTARLTPDIADNTKNVVVQKCRIHNDASIDISKDGRLLVALLPVARLRHPNHWLGVYSLEWGILGQCLYTALLEQSAVSVALSPTARHLAVGLGARRVVTLPHARNNVFALLYKLSPLESTSRTGMSPVKELEQNWEQGFTSLNCLRWAPQPGQGLVYANNTGQLIIMS